MMPYFLWKLDDAPIVVVCIRDWIDATSHFELSRDVADLIAGLPGKIYRINDLTGARVNLVDMIHILSQVAKGWAGTASDPRIVTYLVFNHPNMFLGLASCIRRWHWARESRICASMQEALALARSEHGQPQSVTPDGLRV